MYMMKLVSCYAKRKAMMISVTGNHCEINALLRWNKLKNLEVLETYGFGYNFLLVNTTFYMLLKICGRKWAILIQKVGKWVVVGKRENSASGGRGIMSAGRVFRHRPPWAEP